MLLANHVLLWVRNGSSADLCVLMRVGATLCPSSKKRHNVAAVALDSRELAGKLQLPENCMPETCRRVAGESPENWLKLSEKVAKAARKLMDSCQENAGNTPEISRKIPGK